MRLITIKPATFRAACTLILCVSAAAQEAQPDRNLLVIPVHHLLFAEEGPAAPRMNTLLMAEPDPRRLLPASRFHVLRMEQLVDLVRLALQEDLDQEGVSLQIMADTFIATGPRKLLAAAEKTLRDIAAVMCRRLSVEARLYAAEGNESFPAVIKAADLDEITASLPMLWQARTLSHSGQQVAMAQERFTTYVRDADVEVATKAKIGNPEVRAVFEGVRLLVESHNLVGGKEAVVMCQFAIGDLREPIAQRTTGVPELSALGTPKLDSNFGSFAGRLHKGDALAVRLRSSAGSGSNLLLVLKVDDEGDPSAAVVRTGPGNMAILSISALTSSSLSELNESFDDELDASTGHLPAWNRFVEEDEDSNVPDADGIVELLASSLNLRQMEDASVEHAGGYILLNARQGARAQAIRLLQNLQDRWLQTVEVRATTTLTPVEDSGGALARPAAKQQPRHYQSVTFPALAGHAQLLVKGIETCTTRDFNPEIAEESAIPDPVVVNVFSGIAVNITPVLVGQRVEARLKLHLSHVTTDIRQPTEQKEGGDLFLPKVDRAYFARNGAFEHGLDVPLGSGPIVAIDKQRCRMHQSIRLRKP